MTHTTLDQTPASVVNKYFHCLSTGDFGTLGGLFHPEIIWHQPGQGQLSGTYKGVEAVFALFGEFMKISSGSFKIDSVDHVMENGNFVTATISFSAAKANASIKMAGADLMKVEHGKITEVWLFSADQAAEDKFWIKL